MGSTWFQHVQNYSKGEIGIFDRDDDDEEIKYTGLVVRCSCPDGDRQAVKCLKTGELWVCKHAAAALDGVLDTATEAEVLNREKRALEQAAENKRKRQKYESEQRQLQNESMPGERERILHGLKCLNAKDIVEAIKEKIKSVEGLKMVSGVFTNDVMPLPRMKFCVRCNENYDDQYKDQRVCRVMHPEHCTREKWDGSKKSWTECERCRKSFNCSGMHELDRNAIYDQGIWCFEGEHTDDQDLVDSEEWEKDYFA
uniref:Uncharacterized protein n=1 Tax=Leptocylindrus danicus TaxID=163516 RepID=A0A7S2P2S8_9STRA|mmetsp:Transcript_21639/g.32298  ORF Transcript_21639/g.32298 Transcript_21639/m.32298 type:complete len:255 (+) Transcript_21639:234-998(+)